MQLFVIFMYLFRTFLSFFLGFFPFEPELQGGWYETPMAFSGAVGEGYTPNPTTISAPEKVAF